MKSQKFLFAIVAVTTMLTWTCSNKDKHAAESMKEIISFEISAEESKPNVPETYISSSAALENPNDTARKMIRTADIKFKVKDVIKSTYTIENIVVHQGGFVQHTNLTSQINNTNEMQLTKDTVLITTYYTVLNELILRVPNTKLDITLKEIATLVDFMDYRIIDAQDVTLNLLTKRLEQARLARYDRRMSNAIDNKGRKLDDIAGAEDNLLYKQQQADEAKLANLTTLDKIKFSTITLSLYQNQNIKYDKIECEKELKPYTELFGSRFCDALSLGWRIIVEIVLFLTNLWAIILFGIIVCCSVISIKKKRKNKN